MTAELPTTKLCRRGAKCVNPEGPLLPYSEFYKEKRNKLGLRSMCKACVLAINRVHYTKKPATLEIPKTTVCNSGDSCVNPSGPELPITEFHRGRGPYGRRAKCKQCVNATYNKKYHECIGTDLTYRSKQLQKAKRFRQRHAVSVKAWLRNYYASYIRRSRLYWHKNKLEIRVRGRAYARKHKQQNLERVYRWYRSHPEARRPKYAHILFSVPVHRTYDWQCVVCGSSSSLNAHHRISYSRLPKHLRQYTPLGVTMCAECHRKYHHDCGRGCNYRKQFDRWLIKQLFLRVHQNEVAPTVQP